MPKNDLNVVFTFRVRGNAPYGSGSSGKKKRHSEAYNGLRNAFGIRKKVGQRVSVPYPNHHDWDFSAR